MTHPRRNIELKARCPDLEHAAEAARKVGAFFQGTLIQTDTYFHTRDGRLKLRETEGAPAELIWYARPDTTDFRGSDYYILPIPKPEETRIALSRALGVRGQVDKSRRLYIWHNVRIHLDEVSDLGNFIEFEAVISQEADEESSLGHLATLTAVFGIKPEDRLGSSYSDLLGL